MKMLIKSHIPIRCEGYDSVGMIASERRSNQMHFYSAVELLTLKY